MGLLRDWTRFAVGALGAKRLTQMRHNANPPWFLGGMPRTKYDYVKEIGTGIGASVLMAPIMWLQRALQEAPFQVYQRTGTDDEREAIDHPLTALIRRPNAMIADEHLIAATVFSWVTDGNAYWVKIRGAGGLPVELWYVPHWSITPKWPGDGSAFISHYEYSPGSANTIRFDPDEIVHFRCGMDPRNPRLGLSPIWSALREIWTDMEAANMVASLARNVGVPGLVLSPDREAALTVADEDALKAYIMERTTGDHRGEPLVFTQRMRAERFGFSPRDMDLSSVRDQSEERLCALLGIPASVVGFGSGMDTTRVGAVQTELRRMAWDNGVIPIQRAWAGEIGRSLLPDFGEVNGFEVDWDRSKVAALQEDEDAKARRVQTLVSGGVMSVAAAQRYMGIEVDEAAEYYLRGFATVEVPVGAPPMGRELLGGNGGDDDDGPPQIGQRAAPLLLAKHEHTITEGRVVDRNRRARPSPAQFRFIRALEAAERLLGAAMTRELTRFFRDLGTAAASTARDLLAEEEGKAAGPDGQKDIAQDSILADRILEAMGLADRLPIFRSVYEAHYLRTARETAALMEVIGLATDLPDSVARAVMATGGRRAGLVDLPGQTRRALFDAITEGRAAGEGAEALAARIRGEVPRGPWRDADTRAMVISRTETKYAQNISAVERARAEGVQLFLVFDARLGPTDEICEQLNGQIVTAAEAEQLAQDEHPNGTRSFSPYFGEL